MIENLIIGAGPAGIQMAHLLSDHLVVEKAGTACSFFRTFPRQRRFISINKSRDRKYDWNSFIGPNAESLRDYTETLYPSADDYIRYIEEFIDKHNINIRFNFEVKSIEKTEDVFIINGGELKARKVFFGIGVGPRAPPFERGYTYASMPLDPEVYRGKRVHIIGSGNAAFETADYLAPYTDVTEIWGRNVNAWKTHYPGHARSINFTSIDSYYLKARTILHFTEEDSFPRSQLYREAMEYIQDHPDHLVIWCIGFEFKSELVKDLVTVDKFPVCDHNFESTMCPGLFFIGATSQYHDYKKGTSAFIHGFRYNCEYLHRYITGGIKCEPINSKDELVAKVFHQLNNSSALFHRFDQFCDLVGSDGDTFYYVQEIPIGAVEQMWPKQFTIKLGYTNELSDTFNQEIYIHPRDAHKGKFIHPIINYNSLVFHLPEEQLNEYTGFKTHEYPFRIYLEHILGAISLGEVKMYIDSI